MTAIAILGAGSMGTAILTGLLEHPLTGGQWPIRITMQSSERAEKWQGDSRVRALAVSTNQDANREAARGADVVIVSVKPALIRETLREIRDELSAHTLVISVAAGVTLDAIERALPDGAAAVRVMPNTPALVGKAVTGICFGSAVSPAQRELTTSIFDAVGSTIEVDEAQLVALSAVSGSGPAYVFAVIEAMVSATERLGFDPETAREMVVQTFSGSLELLEASGEAPAELRRQVTSPRGTTEQALNALDAAQPGAIFDEMFAAAIARSAEIAAENS